MVDNEVFGHPLICIPTDPVNPLQQTRISSMNNNRDIIFIVDLENFNDIYIEHYTKCLKYYFLT
jgi:hypothetical protein